MDLSWYSQAEQSDKSSCLKAMAACLMELHED